MNGREFESPLNSDRCHILNGPPTTDPFTPPVSVKE